MADPDGGGDILKLDYTIPPGTAAGVYAKAFPASLGRRSHRRGAAGRQGDRRPSQSRQIAAAVEIKGTAGVQRIPVTIQSDWAPVEETIDWQAIGAVKEVVFLVSNTVIAGPLTGTILIDARFERLPELRKLEHAAVGTARRRAAGQPARWRC